MRVSPASAAVVSDMMIGEARYVGRRASQSVGCGGRDAYAHMCIGRGVVVMMVMVVVRA